MEGFQSEQQSLCVHHLKQLTSITQMVKDRLHYVNQTLCNQTLMCSVIREDITIPPKTDSLPFPYNAFLN